MDSITAISSCHYMLTSKQKKKKQKSNTDTTLARSLSLPVHTFDRNSKLLKDVQKQILVSNYTVDKMNSKFLKHVVSLTVLLGEAIKIVRTGKSDN